MPLTRDKGVRRANLVVIVLFGIAFGSVEAAVVYYLRALGHFHGDYSLSHYRVFLNLGVITFVSPTHALLINHHVNEIETVHECASIVMLTWLAFVSAQNWKQRVGAFLVSFACWDLTYYLFLRVLDNWPKSLMTRDVYFLVPVT